MLDQFSEVDWDSFGEKELALIEMLADPLDQRTKDEKSEAAGFHTKHVYYLQRNRPEFARAVRVRMLQHVAVNLPSVYKSLLGQATKGRSVKAAELLLKAAGEIPSGGISVSQTNVNKGAPRPDPDRFAKMSPDELEREAERHIERLGRLLKRGRGEGKSEPNPVDEGQDGVTGNAGGGPEQIDGESHTSNNWRSTE